MAKIDSDLVLSLSPSSSWKRSRTITCISWFRSFRLFPSLFWISAFTRLCRILWYSIFTSSTDSLISKLVFISCIRKSTNICIEITSVRISIMHISQFHFQKEVAHQFADQLKSKWIPRNARELTGKWVVKQLLRECQLTHVSVPYGHWQHCKPADDLDLSWMKNAYNVTAIAPLMRFANA